ncbi:fibrous sheath CABYR-binding protein-like [Asparagus officinalis]|uniref:fibrous sheath CABYR-binding protein-like n=1 Tax=Asparagus officinalis TaxID=4686 RepID=UPI00098E2A1D|nr:fibrous sheath CABYR-binding protein-like [Asparagus officinalis]
MTSMGGKRATTSSRKGKQVADSDESDEFEMSNEEDDTENEAEADTPHSPVARRTRRASSPKSPSAPSKPVQMMEKTIPLSSSNKMTVKWPIREESEEEEEDVTPLISRKRSRSPTSSEAQPYPSQGIELRTKFHHESSEVPRDTRGQEEVGEIMPEPSSLSLMDVDESSFTQQVHRAMSEEPVVKLKEVGASSSAADPATVVEDIPIDEPGEQEISHDVEIDDFNEHSFNLNFSEDDHQRISDLLSDQAPTVTAGPTTRVGSTEVDTSEGPPAEIEPSAIVPPIFDTVEAEPVAISDPSSLVHEVGVSKATVEEKITTTTTPLESSPKRLADLNPMSSKVLIEQSSDVAGLLTSTILGQTPVVIEPTPVSTSQALPSSLSDRIQAFIDFICSHRSSSLIIVRSYPSFIGR